MLVALLGVVSAAAPDAVPVRTVEAVDLSRYAGEWFEVSRFPNRFQRDCAGGVTARYTARADGRIDVANRCLDGNGRVVEALGVARVVDRRTSAKLKVRFAPAWLSFVPFVWGDYWVIGLADDYSWAVVGSPDRAYLWVLSRTPVLPAPHLANALAAARASGFDVARLMSTHQPGP